MLREQLLWVFHLDINLVKELITHIIPKCSAVQEMQEYCGDWCNILYNFHIQTPFIISKDSENQSVWALPSAVQLELLNSNPLQLFTTVYAWDFASGMALQSLLQGW